MNERIVSKMLFAAIVIALIYSISYGNHVIAQTVRVTHRLDRTATSNIGPVIIISCEVSDIPAGSVDAVVQWKLREMVLSENTKLVKADSSRYSVFDNGYRLSLRDALKEDEGNYACNYSLLISSLEGTSRKYFQSTTFVPVFTYLPPLNYPVCSIEPSTFIIGNTITFSCESGYSIPPVNLQLVLEMQDGSSVELSTANTTRNLTDEDNNAVLFCHMTSDTFPTAQRNCSAGPITVIPTTSQPPSPITTRELTSAITSNTVANTEAKEARSTDPHVTAPEEMEPYSSKTWGIIGGSSGAFFVILIIIIIVVFLRLRGSNGTNKGNKQSPYVNVHSPETKGGSASSHLPSTSTNHTHDDDKLELRPVYAAVNKNNKPTTPPEEDTPVYESTEIKGAQSFQPTDSSDTPVYAKVNKGYIDSTEDSSKRDSSTFFDNIIYSPSGPY